MKFYHIGVANDLKYNTHVHNDLLCMYSYGDGGGGGGDNLLFQECFFSKYHREGVEVSI